MPSNRTCPNPSCPNRGVLVLDTNFLLFLIEGTIRYVRDYYPDLTTKASRLEHVLDELAHHLSIIRDCCSLDGNLHISNRVLYEEVLVVDPRAKDLAQLKSYRNGERARILRVVCNHFPQPSIVPDREIQALRSQFTNPNIRPEDRDASLMIVACHLATSGQPTIVLTNDPDFVDPIKLLMHQGSVGLGEETFPTNLIIYRDYSKFLLRLHDCCGLPTTRYKPLAIAYLLALYKRSPNLERQEVRRRDEESFEKGLKILADSIEFKSAGAQARG